MLTINYHAFDSLPARPWTRHLFVNVEADGAAWAIVVRGEDKHVVGRTNDPARAALVWNEIDGAYCRFIVATGDSREELERIASDALAFYRSSEPIGERLAAVGSGAPLLPLLLSFFSAADFSADGWRRA